MIDIHFHWLQIAKVIIAMFFGGLIGFEREMAGKPAGLRTHILVAGAAAVLVVLGDFMINHFAQTSSANFIRADPFRIISAIVTGISFLGAGTIIFKNKAQSVEGLTTAASILFDAAIAIAAALGQIALAGALTIFVIMVLVVLVYIEQWIDQFRKGSFQNNSNKHFDR